MTAIAHILLVEDNPGDVVLTQEEFEDSSIPHILHVARDGDEALDFLFQRNGFEEAPVPDVMLLDLNLPKTDGREVLQVMQNHGLLEHITVVVLTSSQMDRDVLERYGLHSECYLVKPIDVEAFMRVLKQVGGNAERTVAMLSAPCT